ncbi:MAG: glycosyltransferase [Nibricoccus sp.]
MDPVSVPHLCYYGNIPVEATSAGPAQLYRILHTYPTERLRIIEADCKPSQPQRRILGANYSSLMPAFERGWYFARMRAPRLFWMMLEAESWRQARLVQASLKGFPVEAILAIHEGFGWYMAARIAQRLRVPLHLILHDDWFRCIPMAPLLKERFERAFGAVYRAASGRLCISPYMEEEYARRFGAPGRVLYPVRDPKAPQPTEPPVRLSANSKELTVAYAGNLWHKSNWESLRNLASALETVGGRLLIFGPTKPDDAASNGLQRANVSVRGFVPNLIETLREEAQVVFVAMAFDANERRNMEICFPSKMTEYTAAGLPVLIHGPAYSSAVRWAQAHTDAAEVVLEQNQSAVETSLRRLLDPAFRVRLAQRALELGRDCFSFETGIATLHSTLTAAQGQRIGRF